MRIAIGNDHAATEMKQDIVSYLEKLGHTVINVGTDDTLSVDYPVIAKEVCDLVAEGKCEKGILICGTGIGMSMAANKIKGIRAACCSDPVCVRLTREHNDANVLTFGARIVGSVMVEEMVRVFVETEFAGGRHQKRVELIAQLEGK